MADGSTGASSDGYYLGAGISNPTDDIANATGSAANPTDVSLASATQATIAGDDVVLIYDTSATALATMTRTNFVAGIGGTSQPLVYGYPRI